MFGLLYLGDDGMVFEIFDTLDNARNRAKTCLVMGCDKVTVFDYNKGQDMFLEFFDMEAVRKEK